MTLLVVIFCLMLNALFSSFEMAFVTVGHDDLLDVRTKRHFLERLRELKLHPERTLSVIQIGITLVGILAAAAGGSEAVKTLEPYLIQEFALREGWAEAIAIILVIVPLTYLTVVIGELLPKSIALRHPLIVLRLLTPFILLIDKLLKPIVSFLEFSTHSLIKILGFGRSDAEPVPKKVDIERLEDYHQEFVLNLVHLRGLQNRDVMIPWEQVVKINYADEEPRVNEVINESRHTRLPVVDDGHTVVGILHTKEYHAIPHDQAHPWQGYLRPIMYSHPDEKVLTTFMKMQQQKQHMAVVQEEDGPIGIITMENILEEIVGDIEDEDDDQRMLKLLSKRKTTLDPKHLV